MFSVFVWLNTRMLNARPAKDQPTAKRGSAKRVLAGKGGTAGKESEARESPRFGRRTVPREIKPILQSVMACKWSLTVFTLIQNDVRRPGAMERAVDGLSTKVLNACLRRLVELGLLERRAFSEIPPRVEYHLTPFGRHFTRIFDAIDELQGELDRGEAARSMSAPATRLASTKAGLPSVRAPGLSLAGR